MKKNFITVLLLAFSFSLSAQTSNKEETEIFLSQIINKWNSGIAINDNNVIYIEGKPVFSNIENNLFKTSLDTSNLGDRIPDPITEESVIFSKQDSIEICNQINKSLYFSSILKSQPNIQLISSKKIKKIFRKLGLNAWANNHRHTKYEGFTSISLPLFYRNYTRAIFYEANYCGTLCGSGAVYIYYKINNVWVRKNTLTGWII